MSSHCENTSTDIKPLKSSPSKKAAPMPAPMKPTKGKGVYMRMMKRMRQSLQKRMRIGKGSKGGKGRHSSKGFELMIKSKWAKRYGMQDDPEGTKKYRMMDKTKGGTRGSGSNRSKSTTMSSSVTSSSKGMSMDSSKSKTSSKGYKGEKYDTSKEGKGIVKRAGRFFPDHR